MIIIAGSGPDQRRRKHRLTLAHWFTASEARRRPWVRAKVGAAVLAILVLVSCAHHDRAAGEACDDDGDCVPDTSCAAVDVRDGGALYECVAHCTPSNTSFSRCEGGGVCYPVSSWTPDVWGCFLGNDIPIGEPCSWTFSCVRGAICFGDPDSVCTPVCDRYGCGLLESCASWYDCQEGLFCGAIGTTGTLADNACIRECPSPPGGVGLCEDGSTCIPFYYESGRLASYACVPGGSIPLGAPCSNTTECERGGVCVGDGPTGVCSRACNSDEDCPNGAHCDAGVCPP